MLAGLICLMSHSAIAKRVESEWHQAEWRPASGLTQRLIWPDEKSIPDKFVIRGKEELTKDGGFAGKVSIPTMTIYPARGKNSGTAVVIFPGGGYWCLAMQLEGTDVCDWLTAKGITCILLKYRVPGDGLFPRSGCYPGNKAALEDAQRTIRMVRAQASQLKLNPHKIGVLGFSAGGHLVAATSTLFDKNIYKPIDATDKVSCRPDFAIAIYPGHLTEHTNKSYQLNPYVPVTKKTPPTFIVQAQDDPVDGIANSIAYFTALKKAGIPAELHIFSEGKHAFGLKASPKLPVSAWPSLAEKWLQSNNLLAN
ncbi:MAG: alpha/beta hydrolase [Candidatus Obscuribacterales bacterium]|nr:alpha/beta hydrolase [Candidatus Obscuribacterales bacterium]